MVNLARCEFFAFKTSHKITIYMAVLSPSYVSAYRTSATREVLRLLQCGHGLHQPVIFTYSLPNGQPIYTISHVMWCTQTIDPHLSSTTSTPLVVMASILSQTSKEILEKTILTLPCPLSSVQEIVQRVRKLLCLILKFNREKYSYSSE